MHKKIFILILIDQITKLVFWPRDFFFGPLHIHPVKNFGLIFSLDFGLIYNLIIIAAALGVFIYYFLRNHFGRTVAGKISFALIIAGAISNLIDRLYLGYVRDFIDLSLGFTFNFADGMIVVGIVWLLFKNNHETNTWN